MLKNTAKWLAFVFLFPRASIPDKVQLFKGRPYSKTKCPIFSSHNFKFYTHVIRLGKGRPTPELWVVIWIHLAEWHFDISATRLVGNHLEISMNYLFLWVRKCDLSGAMFVSFREGNPKFIKLRGSSLALYSEGTLDTPSSLAPFRSHQLVI